MTKQLKVNIPATTANSYPIIIKPNLLQHPETWLKNLAFDQLVVITDHTVRKLYGENLNQNLQEQGYKTVLLSFPAGEKSKNQAIKSQLEERMLRQRCNRNTLCIALGGGVVGDLTGFIAATYMRGIPYLQIPTSLLAMVDSSVGGKTAIDTPYGKNLIGAFWQPKAVIADLHCLTTLPSKQLIAGLVEAFKMFITSDVKSFSYAQKNLQKITALDNNLFQNIIYRAVKIKADVVAQDERESGLRMILNFGHTIGHAVEQLSNYKILHGYAVGLGILVEAKIAQLLGILSSANYEIIQTLMAKLGVRGHDLKKYDSAAIIQATQLDKKAKTGAARYVLLKNLGQVYHEKNSFAHPVEDAIVKAAVAEVIKFIA